MFGNVPYVNLRYIFRFVANHQEPVFEVIEELLLDKTIKSWAASFTEEVLQYAQPATVNDMEVGIQSKQSFLTVVLLL